MTSVITVTLNPAIDETVTLDTLRPGHVHRARGVGFHAGGKGVNVASCLADWHTGEVTATGLLGTANAGVFEALFAAKSINDEFLRIRGETRTNIKLSHDGDTTDINLPGLKIGVDEVAAIIMKISALAANGAYVLLAGSLPHGVNDDIYAVLTKALTARGARVILDTSGAPLKAALNGATLPYCIKPNRTELEDFFGAALNSDADIVRAGKSLLERGVKLVVVSLGAEGSLYITDKDILRAALAPVAAASTVGAGDAMVAGIISALREDAGLERIARLATAFAAAKLTLAGANLPGQKIVEALAEKVQITKLGGAET